MHQGSGELNQFVHLYCLDQRHKGQSGQDERHLALQTSSLSLGL